MAKLTKAQEKAVANALVRLMTLARHSLSPAQERMATSSAEELVWLLGLDSYTSEGRTYQARAPEGEIIDGTCRLMLSGPAGRAALSQPGDGR